MRWFVFDDETAEVVVSQWRRGGAEILHDEPLDAALQATGAVVMVLPSRVPGQVLLAQLQRRPALAGVQAGQSQPATIPPKLSPTAVAQGPGSKSWWRRIVA